MAVILTALICFTGQMHGYFALQQVDDVKAHRLEGRRQNLFKILQMNMLADGLANDGFMSPRDDDNPNLFFHRVKDTMKLVAAAKATGAKEITQQVLAATNILGEGSAGEEALQKLIKEETDNSERLIDWTHRLTAIVKIVVESGADVVCIQELDKYSELASALDKHGYTSVGEKGVGAYPEKLGEGKYTNLKGYAKADKLRKVNYRTALAKLEEHQIAFAPNKGSNARKFFLNNVMDDEGISKEKAERDHWLATSSVAANRDDQGTAIFWKKKSFKFASLKFEIIGLSTTHKDGKEDAAALKVELEHTPHGVAQSTPKMVAVASIHLSSGHPKEARRVGELRDAAALWKDTSNVPVVFAGDLNSEIWFDITKTDATETCFDVLTGTGTTGLGMKSVWGTRDELETGTAPVSVIKMRGPATNQYGKMGEFALETIDHIFYKGDNVAFTGNVKVVGDTVHLTKDKLKEYQQGFEKGLETPEFEEIVSKMLPTPTTPSDHFPVTAEFELK